jgi:hypothetical protein
VEEERIKSAFELAMERISAMPELTQEEIAAQKEKQYRPVGEANAGRYLKGLISGAEILSELERYGDEPRQIVRRGLISGLCAQIHLQEEPETIEKALKGLGQLVPGKNSLLEKAAQDFRRIADEFEQNKDKMSSHFGTLAAKRIAELGIAGSAVKPNLEEYEEWQKELAGMRQTCETRLKALRSELLDSLQAD